MNRLGVALVAIGTITSVHAQIIGDPQPVLPATSTAVATASATYSLDVPLSVPTYSLDEPQYFSILQAASGVSTSTVAPIAAASPSVVSIFFPGADELPYVGSVIGGDSNAQVIAISCGPGVNSDTCGFPSSVTVTAGPSTAYVSVSNEEATFIYDCKITGSTAAVCAETFNGNAAYIATTSGKGAASGSTSSVLTETLGPKDIKWMPITITGKGSGTVKPAPTPAPPASDGSVNPPASNAPVVSPPAPAASSAVNGTGWVGIPPAMGTPNANTPVGVWTGGAGRLVGLGNYAAGILALVGLIF